MGCQRNVQAAVDNFAQAIAQYATDGRHVSWEAAGKAEGILYQLIVDIWRGKQ